MVVEVLTFAVAAGERDEWLAVEEVVWSRFLEAQPGFIKKQMWVPSASDDKVLAVIWWESMEQWKAITAETVAQVDARMGEWFRTSECHSYDVVRDG